MDRLSGFKMRKRLDNLIKSSRSDNYASISTLIGKNHAYIQQYVTRGTPKHLSARDRQTIARHFGVPESELEVFESGNESLPSTERSEASHETSHIPGDTGYVLINSYDLCQLANVRPNHQMVARSQTPFHRSWLPSDMEIDARKLAMFVVKGDSMSPTLNEGSHIVVDMSSALPVCDGIYVFKAQDSVHVKRISINPVSGRVSVRSDNPMYENWPGCSPERINFVGRVIWVGSKV